MKTDFQRFLHSKINEIEDHQLDQPSTSIKHDKTGSLAGRLTTRSIPARKRLGEIIKFSETNDIADSKLLDRICSMYRINQNTRTYMQKICASSPEQCAEDLVENINNNIETEIHDDDLSYTSSSGYFSDNYSERLRSPLDFSSDDDGYVTDINISNEPIDITPSDIEDSSLTFEKSLQNWVSEGGQGKHEAREAAASEILEVYKTGGTDLDLPEYQLTSLPSSIARLTELEAIDISSTTFDTFPECLYKCKNLKDVTLGKNISQLTPGMIRLKKQNNCRFVTMNKSLRPNLRLITKLGAIDKAVYDYCKGTSIHNKDYLPEALKEEISASLQDFDKLETPDEIIKFAKKIKFFEMRIVPYEDGDSSINILGCSLPPGRKNLSSSGFELSKRTTEQLKFCYNNMASLVSFIEPEDYPFEEMVDFLSFCAADFKDDSINVHLTPIPDFSIPRIEHIKCLLDQLKVATKKKKGILLSCGAGQGRTGTMLAMASTLDHFKKLNSEEKKQGLTIERNFIPSSEKGTFSHLDDVFKTTPFIGKVVEKLRTIEKNTLSVGKSVETPNQFFTLELFHLMLVINENLQNMTSMTDDEILDIVYNNGFKPEFVKEFGSVLFGTDKLDAKGPSPETVLVDFVRTLHERI